MKSPGQNAAILYFGGNYKTDAPQLMGRNAATEGFLKAFASHAKVDRFYCHTNAESEYREFEKRIHEFSRAQRQTTWISFVDNGRLAEPGCLYRPGPDLGFFAWQRRRHDMRSYSICGVTHTTATKDVMDALGNLLIAPVFSWDALVCTSTAVKAMVVRLLHNYAEYLQQRTAGSVKIAPQLPIIPLGVDCASFADRSYAAEARAKFRAEHGIGEDDIVVLFFGRLTPIEKANPVPMYQSLEQAAGNSGRRFHLIQAGWFASETFERDYRSGADTFAPSVNHIFLDGRRPEIRRGIWYAADIFTSLSDNIQETFGLTPIEAMAAGLPVVVSDWDGYRDTVRHGVDGILVPSLTPTGAAEDIAFRYESATDNYGQYIGVTSQCTAVDVAVCAEAFSSLATNADLRRSMGEAGRQRAIETFDWSVIIQSYQNLWADLAERRRSSVAPDPRHKNQPSNPLREDPFLLFAAYPTRLIGLDDLVTLRPGADRNRLKVLRSHRLTRIGAALLATDAEIERVLSYLARSGPCRVAALLKQFPVGSRQRMYRTFGWMAKTDLVAIAPSQTPADAADSVKSGALVDANISRD